MPRQNTAGRNAGPSKMGKVNATVSNIWDSEAAVQTVGRVGNTKANWTRSCSGTVENPPTRAINCVKGGRYGLITADKGGKTLIRAGDKSLDDLEDAGFLIEWI